MNKKILSAFLAALLALSPLAASAEAFPEFPMAVWGSLKENGSAVPAGATVQFLDGSGTVIASLATAKPGQFGGDTVFDENAALPRFSGNLRLRVVLPARTAEVSSAEMDDAARGAGCPAKSSLTFVSKVCRYDVNLSSSSGGGSSSSSSGGGSAISSFSFSPGGSACGSPNGQILYSVPSSNLCYGATAGSVTAVSGGWTWSCGNATCRADNGSPAISSPSPVSSVQSSPVSSQTATAPVAAAASLSSAVPSSWTPAQWSAIVGDMVNLARASGASGTPEAEEYLRQYQLAVQLSGPSDESFRLLSARAAVSLSRVKALPAAVSAARMPVLNSAPAAPAVSSPQNGNLRYIRVSKKANIRATPSAASSIVVTLRRNSPVEVISDRGAWSKILFQGNPGWVRSKYLALFPDVRTAPAGLMAWESQSMDGQPTIPVPAGAKLAVVNLVSGGLEVEWPGGSGFVSSYDLPSAR